MIFHLFNGFESLTHFCGATDAQNQAQQQQASAYDTMTNQAKSVFGSSSTVFGQLQKTFAPIVAQGPSQRGFSPAESAALKSAAITNAGQSYKNAQAAVGNAQAAAGGGNDPAVSSGVDAGVDASLAASAANNTATQLNTIDQNDFATGRDNFNNASKILESSPGVFDPVAGIDNAATNAGNASANTANQIATQDNSWVQSVTGALGGVAGIATGGLMKNIGSTVGKVASSYSQPGGVSGQFQED